MKRSTEALLALGLLACGGSGNANVVEAPMISVDASAALIANEQPVPPGANGRLVLRQGDRYDGKYTCHQGLTSMTLFIDEVAPRDDDAEVYARFLFEYPAGNELVGVGSYRMQGKLEAKTRRLVLKPEAWIDEPPNYVMVGMRGVLAKDGAGYAGTIDGPGCTTFDVKRQGS